MARDYRTKSWRQATIVEQTSPVTYNVRMDDGSPMNVYILAYGIPRGMRGRGENWARGILWCGGAANERTAFAFHHLSQFFLSGPKGACVWAADVTTWRRVTAILRARGPTSDWESSRLVRAFFSRAKRTISFVPVGAYAPSRSRTDGSCCVLDFEYLFFSLAPTDAYEIRSLSLAPTDRTAYLKMTSYYVLFLEIVRPHLYCRVFYR